MAASTAGGYEHKFLKESSKLRDFECPLCLHVTREPSLTSCCGQHFCQSCINRVLTDGSLCPFCKEKAFTVLLDKKQRRRTLELSVYCTMEGRGCTWTGELGDLDIHLSTRCEYIAVDCTNQCEESIQRHHLQNHLSKECVKRRYVCEYCDYEATYEEVCKKHWPECVKYPLCCPNKCQHNTIERSKMEEHKRECPLQLVDCGFAHVGCANVQRKDLASHMEQNWQRHLVMLSTTVQEKTAQKEKDITELQLELEEKDRKIESLQSWIQYLSKLTLPESVYFTISNFSLYRNSATNKRVTGPVLYTHVMGGMLEVHFFMAQTLHQIIVELWQSPGDFDEEVQWPVRCNVVVQLIDQRGSGEHITGSAQYQLEQPEEVCCKVAEVLKVAYSDLMPDSSKYILSDRLNFTISVTTPV